jgi:hypothetical protein
MARKTKISNSYALILVLVFFTLLAGYYIITGGKPPEKTAVSNPLPEPQIINVTVVFKQDSAGPDTSFSYTCKANGTPTGGEYCRIKTMGNCLSLVGGGIVPLKLDPKQTIMVQYKSCSDLSVLWSFLITEH